MLVKNNWLKTNIRDRLKDENSKVRIWARPETFDTNISFEDAACKAAKDIKYFSKEYKRPLYVTLSGGADSDLVVKALVENDVPFRPITMICLGASGKIANDQELLYAYHTMRKYKINPIKMILPWYEMLRIWRQYILPIRGNGFLCGTVVKCNEFITAQNNNGILITSVNGIGGTNSEGKAYAGVYEFDFYGDVFFGPGREIPFHLYSPEIFYATVDHLKYGYNEADFKNTLYGTEWRPKIDYKYEKQMYLMIAELKKGKTINTIEYLILEKNNPAVLMDKLKSFGEEHEIQITLQDTI